MVEEFMLLANIATAEKIFQEFPSCALLRRHPEPPPSNFESLTKAAQSKVLKQFFFSNFNFNIFFYFYRVSI